MSQTYTFQAEIKQLLNTLIHSLYTDREIFLRELISNSSDAIHRIQFEMLTNRDVVSADTELGIWLQGDTEANTLTIIDTGIGMTQEELISNLGTISKSGVKGFLEQIQNNGDNVATNLIGQFGVGFYSIFMVADRVEVTSRSHDPDEDAYRWISTGDETYEIEPADKEDRGTEIKLFLKEDATEFAQASKLREVIRKHSNYVSFPIYLVEEPSEDDEEEKEPQAINAQQAIWRRNSSDIEEEEYKQFYSSMTFDFNEPLHYLHFTTDAPVQFYSLLYVSQSAERPMFSPRQEAGLQLYARKVLIQDYSTDLLPEYLLFVQGVVDSEDLPLNVSRETVQANRVMANLKSAITKRLLREFKRMADKDADKYVQFWNEYGAFIKHGVISDMENKDRLVELLRFRTNNSDGELISLQAYIERMAEIDNQDHIYYVVADNDNSAARSPHIEPFEDRDIEVLYFTDTVDSFLINALTEYEGHSLKNVDDEELDISEIGAEKENEDRPEALPEDDMSKVIEQFENTLGERVAGVRISKVLSGKSPARLVSPEGTLDRHTQRVYKMLDKDYEVPQKILELNQHHVLMHNVLSLMGADNSDDILNLTIEQIYENALLLDGLHPNPAEMVERIQSLMEAATSK